MRVILQAGAEAWRDPQGMINSNVEARWSMQQVVSHKYLSSLLSLVCCLCVCCCVCRERVDCYHHREDYTAK